MIVAFPHFCLLYHFSQNIRNQHKTTYLNMISHYVYEITPGKLQHSLYSPIAFPEVSMMLSLPDFNSQHMMAVRFFIPTHWPPLSPRKYFWYSFLLEAGSTPGPLCDQRDYVNEKFAVTSLGIELVTFWLAAQCLNQLRHRTPPCNNQTINSKI